LILGSLSYGASVVFFIKSLSGLGAARTAALFGLAPFIGAIISLIIFRDWASWTIFPAGGLMALGAWLLLTERHSHLHSHQGISHIHAHWPDLDHRHEHNKLT
jgi:drug/metabolite transporter (DMT)-like permease